jgi:uncharacterized RDD family membrane protein YckC
MKCPKCGYLGFETTERCRNCGYDFSLAKPVEASTELPLQTRDGTGIALDDLSLHGESRAAARLDLDRVLGADEYGRDASTAHANRAAESERSSQFELDAAIRRAARRAVSEAAATAPLPLFTPEVPETPEPDPGPIAAPRPAGVPLSVRRATPDMTRGRTRGTRVTPRREDPHTLQLESAPLEPVSVAAATDIRPTLPLQPASAVARIAATIIDLILLAAIDAAVAYLTLAIGGLTVADLAVVPKVPFILFLLLLNGGYLITFVAATGQTIGKMATGIKVVGLDVQEVGMAGATLRACGCLVSLLTAGLGYLPAFLSADRRSLQDRLAGTRVVRAA